jgi:uncharacterized protein
LCNYNKSTYTDLVSSKPSELFGREYEWDELNRFARSDRQGTRLAVVAGRRRQGKTMLLQALASDVGGMYWQARQQSSAQNLVSFGEAFGGFIGAPSGLRFVGWEQAVDALFAELASRTTTTLVVIDEIGYLLTVEPGFASHLQAALSPGGAARRKGRGRVILCGSAFGQMRALIDADSPLRGRSDIELTLRPFGYREAAEFWGLRANPEAAFRLHSIVGGTPAYRDYSGELPVDGDIDRWVVEQVFNPASPLFREGRVVVAEDPALADQSLYWGVLGALADGAHLRAEIAAQLARPATSLGHALATVVDAGWVIAEDDPRRDRGTSFRLSEPMVRFHRLVIEPAESRLTLRRDPLGIWHDALPIVRSQIYGPHLEDLAKDWMMSHASNETLGGAATQVGSSIVTSGKRTDRRQLDLVAVERTARGAKRVLAIGEVKAGTEPVGVDQLARLDSLAEAMDVGAPGRQVKKILVARAGFTLELTRAARRRTEVELVDLHRLYSGD